MLLGVAHVVVDNLSGPEHRIFGWNESTWVAVGAIGSLVVAFSTLVVALVTKQLASSGEADRKQAEEHHQRALSPFCVLRDASSRVKENTPEVSFTIQNIGAGSAVRVNLLMIPVKAGLEHAGIGIARFMGPMLAGEISYQVKHGFDGWAGRDPFGAFLVQLEFENMFGSWGVTGWYIYNTICNHTILEPASVKVVPQISSQPMPPPPRQLGVDS